MTVKRKTSRVRQRSRKVNSDRPSPSVRPSRSKSRTADHRQDVAERQAAKILKLTGLRSWDQLLDVADEARECQEALSRGETVLAADIADVVKKKARGAFYKWWWGYCWAKSAQERILGYIEGSYSAYGPGKIDEDSVRARVRETIDHWWVTDAGKEKMIACLREHTKKYRKDPKKLQGDEEENRAKAAEWAADEVEKSLKP